MELMSTRDSRGLDITKKIHQDLRIQLGKRVNLILSGISLLSKRAIMQSEEYWLLHTTQIRS